MHFLSLLALLPAALAAPTESHTLVGRQTAVTDELLFGMSLPAFIARRSAQDPPTLDWSSDSCSSSPDNPLGFPFDPACQRHDFGYRNYRAQSRFTDANKLAIDDNFLADLNYQCSGESQQGACEALARVYYQAVRWFGRETPAVTTEELPEEYLDAIAEYEAELEKARAAGKL
ncbi:prokaryotic phospholipase A2-domain-containing protein [Stachybotrys elegans]|uniref:Prokaryotic phospholipase A2-domain-containing protein n=1 Tax=Stachybotrys elegans TaxID=80388 RepID=A0A8K0WUV6_9HYPO|nr:prokaryotic phospholipase A2-domain-containing protein [Stachybotrys elegans]